MIWFLSNNDIWTTNCHPILRQTLDGTWLVVYILDKHPGDYELIGFPTFLPISIAPALDKRKSRTWQSHEDGNWIPSGWMVKQESGFLLRWWLLLYRHIPRLTRYSWSPQDFLEVTHEYGALMNESWFFCLPLFTTYFLGFLNWRIFKSYADLVFKSFCHAFGVKMRQKTWDIQDGSNFHWTA